MNIAIVTFHDDNCSAYALLSDKAKQHYCDRFGYKYFVHSDRKFPERTAHWEKPNAMLEHFDGFDYVVWMDADACIANMDFDIKTIFSGESSKSIYISRDCYILNSGVFAVKTNEVSRKFLEDINGGYDKYKDSGFKENTCIDILLNGKYKEHVFLVPIKKWNSYENVYNHSINNEYSSGDFVLHLPDEDSLPKTNPPYRVKRFTEINRENGI